MSGSTISSQPFRGRSIHRHVTSLTKLPLKPNQFFLEFSTRDEICGAFDNSQNSEIVCNSTSPNLRNFGSVGHYLKILIEIFKMSQNKDYGWMFSD